MKERDPNDVLIITEQRPIKSKNIIPSSSTNNSNKSGDMNPPELTFHKLIGLRGRFEKNELIKSSVPEATFKIICEKPEPIPGSDNYYDRNKKCCDNNNCFGSGEGSPSNNPVLNIALCLIYVSFIVFPPLGLVIFLVFYLCTRNSDMWRNS